MYKILYLPLGEELLIYKEFRHNVIRTLSPDKSDIGLRTPGDRPNDWPISRFKIAYFGSISIADRWITELLERNTDNIYNMRREYFEIIKV